MQPSTEISPSPRPITRSYASRARAWQFAALLPARGEFVADHPLGCHRRRIADRTVFEHIVLALVHGSGYERISTPGCSDRTIRRRVKEWVLVETRGHAPCWATCNPSLPGGVREQTTLERWNKVHGLLGQGVGLLECSRRLNLALNTVKRYARRPQPPAERIVPRYRPTLVDPYRDHLRIRREQDPAVPVTPLFREIKEQSYTGGLNLLYRYLNQGRAEGPRPVTTPRLAARLLLTKPEHLWSKDTELRALITTACPQMAELARLVTTFAGLLTPTAGNDTKLTAWISDVRAADLPHLHSFCTGLEIDRIAVSAALTLPHHNGRTEGVNTRTKRITRQMHGRASFALLRHRILLQ